MNIPEGKRYVTQLGGRELVIETGKYAKQVSGSVTVRYGNSLVLVTAHMQDDPKPIPFLPLTVDYEEKHYAIGKIPGSFLRREGRPGTQATLNARITDRQIRPLFPKQLRNETQVIITVLSADQENDPAPLGAIGASAALAISDIPWSGPTASHHVGYLNGEYVMAPTFQQLSESAMHLTVAASKDAVLMVEASADELPETTMVGAIEFAQRELAPVIETIERMQAELGQPKKSFVPAMEISADDVEAVSRAAEQAGLAEVLLTEGKHERSEAVKALRDRILDDLIPDPDAEGADQRRGQLKAAFGKAEAAAMRAMVLDRKVRSDGRRPDEIRPIWIETGVLPMAHGSAVFTRGETQVLSVSTLGTGRDNRLVDDLGLESTEEFMLHYNFPPYSTGEVKRLFGTSRREQGHGNLARRAVVGQLPGQETFPYVIRSVGETLESNGSSSMATVCATSLSLMDAGVPIKAPVAGIAMGLVMDGDRYEILSDILGSEDALGDMDFKVTGTANGVTALQMDIKVQGITAELMTRALDQAREGRLHILGLMHEALPAPRTELASRAPRIETVQIPSDKIGTVIGPGGKQIRELEALGAKVEIEEDGRVRIYTDDGAVADEVKRRIEALTETPEVGKVYQGKVAKIVDFGAFVNLFPGTDGLLHISQIAEGRVENVSDHLKEGQPLEVKINGIDDRGKIDLVRPELEGVVAPRAPRRAGGPGGGGRRDERGGRGGGGPRGR
ncbi:MAG: polyribonucleotide nucleotidyltransferase [Trueperaceae bacterium]|nr:polyribonucleotide nucleotidyltransferase [Trueperaceae bacterium]